MSELDIEVNVNTSEIQTKQNLEEILDKPVFWTHLLQVAVYGEAAIYGKYLQGLASAGVRPYDWLTGHLSDFAALAAITSFSYLAGYIPPKNPSYSKVNTIFLSSIFTVFEVVDKFSKIPFNGGTFDIWDIPCYWAGAFAAYYGAKGLDCLGKKIIRSFKRLRIK